MAIDWLWAYLLTHYQYQKKAVLRFIPSRRGRLSTDALSISKKGRSPVYSQQERSAIVAALRCVDEVFWEESLEEKEQYIRRYNADVLVMGDDWAGKFDWLSGLCAIEYLPRTPAISTTALIEKIQVDF